MDAARKDITQADDIMPARAIYALTGSLVVGMILWTAMLALIV